MRRLVVGVVLVVMASSACSEPKTAADACRRRAAWAAIGDTNQPGGRVSSAARDIECDEVEREERRQAIAERHRDEDREERAASRGAAAPPTARDAKAVNHDVLPSLLGLWVADYGGGRIETVRVYQEGEKVAAIKVTGDENVPAGKPTFRADLRSGAGAIHAADVGYQSPRWYSGRLVVLTENTFDFTSEGMTPLRFRRVPDSGEASDSGASAWGY